MYLEQIILLSIALITTCSANCPSSKKHVIFIVADDLGWNDLSFHGSNQFLTPNLDSLAYNGLILDNYYTTQLCSPSRSALMSGMNPVNTGMYHRVIYAPQPFGLPLDIKILPQYLKELGYKTHAVGKWHLGCFRSVYTPTKRGFDSHFGYWTAKEDYFNHSNFEFLKLASYYGNDFRRDMNVSTEYNGKYATDLFTDEAINIINSHSESEPLFLYLAHLAVHSANRWDPLQAPAEVIEKFSYIKDVKRRKFAAMVWKLDQSVGRVIEALSQKNMLKDSIIIFTTDNGGPAGGFNQNHASNWPLRGMKDTMWEGGVRGNAFIWSSDLPHSSISRNLMHIQDWLPTILGALNCGIKPSNTTKAIDGRNMWPVLKGEKPSEYDEIILQNDPLREISALRKGNWKLILGTTYGGTLDATFGPSGRTKVDNYNTTIIQESNVAQAMKSQNLGFPTDETIKSIRKNVTVACTYCKDNRTCTPCDPRKEICLFDISKDPCERNNLAKNYPDMVENLIELIKTKYKAVPALNEPIDPRANPIYWNNTWTNWFDYLDPLPTEKMVEIVKIEVI